MDEGENLLAAVLVRIFEAIDEALDHSSLSASEACRDAMEQLEELANDIGIAWDGNLKARAGSLDPDSYSQETMRAQRTRLKTNRRLRRALDTLLKNRCYGLFDEELFVLPIDDFYLKPKASLELLRLLRMISVPRLFFLIMGDIKTVEALFFEKALADWTAVAGPQVFATLPKRAKQEVLARVREMKARYLRKLIPEGQRAIIAWTEWHEALRFTPPLATASDPQLCRLLSNVRICWTDGPGGRAPNLLDYLVSPPLENDDPRQTAGNLDLPDLKNRNWNAVKKFREAYSGLLILDTTPREILDLWMRLNEEACRKRPQLNCDIDVRENLRMIVDCALPALEEQDFLTADDQELLRFVFPTSNRDDLQFATDTLRLTQKISRWHRSPAGDVLVRKHLDWRLRIFDPDAQKGKRQNGPNERKHVPSRQAAWVILLHDLAWNWKRESVLENLVQSLRREIGDPSKRIESTKDLDTRHPGWAWYKEANEKEGRWVHFPLPEVDTFRQLDRFLTIWNYELAEHLESEKPEAGDQQWRTQVARGWAKAAWIVEEDSEPRYYAYVSPKQDTNGGDGGQLAEYVALLSTWNDGKNEKRDEFMEKFFSIRLAGDSSTNTGINSRNGLGTLEVPNGNGAVSCIGSIGASPLRVTIPAWVGRS